VAQSAAAAGGAANEVVIVEGTAGHEGRIIGRGGGTIRDLQDRYGVRIQLKREHGVTEVVGPGAQGAAAAIREIISQVAVMGAPPGADRAAAGPVVGGAKETIPCAGAESRIIGKGGNNIRSLRERTGASIRVLNDSQTCVIEGTPEQVAAAAAVVREHIQQYTCTRSASVRVHVQDCTCRLEN
jgi:far upstream element-binding protein